MRNHLFILSVISLIAFSCKKIDNTPPVIVLNPPDTVYQILNKPFTDPGATASDEVDGNISNNIFIKSNLNVDRVGEYTLVYSVVDKEGNEAAPATRWVFVYNEAWVNAGYYDVTEVKLFPAVDTNLFATWIYADSSVNQRIVFGTFTSDGVEKIYGDINDTVIVIPYQKWGDEGDISVQGNGFINSSVISVQFTRKDNYTTTLWNTTFTRH